MRATLVAVLCAGLAAAAWGFSNYAPGDVLPEASLTGLDGKKHPFIGKSTVNVFVFFRGDQKHSELALKEIAAIEKEVSDKSVSFVAIASSSVDPAEAKRLATAATLAAPVLIDENDALYGKLGTALTPVVGVADAKRKLLAYLPFTKLNYQDTIRGWVRFGLGELTQEQLNAILSPPASVDGGPLQVARRYMNLATRQFKSGNSEGALASLKKSFEQSNDLAGSHALLGQILASKGKCAEAMPELKRALELEASDEVALAGLAACGEAPDGGVAAAGPGADGGARN